MSASKLVNDISVVVVFGALGVGAWQLYKAQKFVKEVVKEPARDFWNWYYDVNEKPDWVKPFSWEFLGRNMFDENWIMTEEAHSVLKMNYENELSAILTADKQLKVEYREKVPVYVVG